jgi:hypothetical protein
MYLLLFHDRNGFANAPQSCYSTLLVLLLYNEEILRNTAVRPLFIRPYKFCNTYMWHDRFSQIPPDSSFLSAHYPSWFPRVSQQNNKTVVSEIKETRSRTGGLAVTVTRCLLIHRGYLARITNCRDWDFSSFSSSFDTHAGKISPI